MTEDEKRHWQAAIGVNADRYLKVFERIESKGSGWVPGWNTAACLFSTGWFCFRRMYGWALLNFFAPWILIFGVAFGVAWIRPSANVDVPAAAMVVAYMVVVFVLLPLFTDSLYYRHLAPRLTERRPPSVWTAVGAGAAGFACLPLIFAILIPAYGDYTPRAKVSEAILSASGMRTEITEFHARHGRLPQPDEAARFRIEGTAAPSRYTASVTYDPQTRRIVITLGEIFPGKQIALKVEERSGALHWTCGPIDLERKYLPSGCRD